MLTDTPIAGPIPRALIGRVEAAVLAMRAGDQFRLVHVLVPDHVKGTPPSRALFPDTGCFGAELSDQMDSASPLFKNLAIA